MEFNTEKKTVVIAAGIVSYTVVYVVIRYCAPLFAPFIVAYVFAWIMRPAAVFFIKKFRIGSSASAVAVIAFAMMAVVGGAGWLGFSAFGNLGRIVGFWNKCSRGVTGDIRRTCCYVEKCMGLNEGVMYRRICDYAGNIDLSHVTSQVMSGSVSAAVASAECIVFLVVVFIAAFYFIKDKEKIDSKRRKSLFGEEINRIIGSVYTTGIAYLRAQLVIMGITFVICLAGFYLAGIKYFAIYAGAVAVLDALPLFGTGLLVLPVALIYLVKGKITAAFIMLLVFIVCYFVREILEPKIMGKNTGLSPVVTMAAMYAGYKLFGILGVILGPVAYIAAGELTRIIVESCGRDTDGEV